AVLCRLARRAGGRRPSRTARTAIHAERAAAASRTNRRKVLSGVSARVMLRDLTPPQRLIFWILTVLCGASRFLALARSMWDWDEALFCLGMREYDVTRHHPH